MSILGRLNGILHFIENPCNEPWTVFIDAATPWANKAAMAFLAPDIMQTVRTATSPGELRSGRHMRRGINNERITSAHPPGIPDPYEYIGHIIRKPIDSFIKANSTWGSKAIFSLVGVVEQGLWNYMLFDEATKLIYHSMADARKSEYCRRWNNGSGLRSGPMLPSLVMGWGQMAVPLLHYEFDGVGMPWDGAQTPSEWIGCLDLVASFSGFAVGGTGQQVHGMRIIDRATGEVLASEGPYPYFTGQSIDLILHVNMPVPRFFRVEIFQELGTMQGEGILFANFSGQRRIAPKPPKPAHHYPHRPRKPKRPKNNVYKTDDNSTVIQTPNTQYVKPPRKKKP